MVKVSTQGASVSVAVDGKPRYVFPVEDCALLPVPNTTVEMLARYLARRVKAEVDRAAAVRLSAIEIEVEENFGQSATYRETLS
jgi:6-pyruvoyltetrahydropterin/6-carboxytetrahydropterin synthase